MGVKLDKVIMSSLFESFKNYESPSTSITISGSIPVGGKDFESLLEFDRDGTIADIYIHKQGSDSKKSFNQNWRILDFTGTSDVQATCYAQYTDDNKILFTISVTNFGASPYAVTTQTYDFDVELFDAPIPN